MMITFNAKNFYNQMLANICFEKIRKPIVAAIQIGNNKDSINQISEMKNELENIGVDFQWYYYNENISTEALINEIKDLQNFVNIVYLVKPLPIHINEDRVVKVIDPAKRFLIGKRQGLLKFLDEAIKSEWKWQTIVIIDEQSDLIIDLLKRKATVIACHSNSIGLWDHIRNANLVICNTKKQRFLNCYAVHVPVVDLNNCCYNIECRNIIQENWIFEKIAVLEALRQNKVQLKRS